MTSTTHKVKIVPERTVLGKEEFARNIAALKIKQEQGGQLHTIHFDKEIKPPNKFFKILKSSQPFELMKNKALELDKREHLTVPYLHTGFTLSDSYATHPNKIVAPNDTSMLYAILTRQCGARALPAQWVLNMYKDYIKSKKRDFAEIRFHILNDNFTVQDYINSLLPNKRKNALEAFNRMRHPEDFTLTFKAIFKKNEPLPNKARPRVIMAPNPNMKIITGFVSQKLLRAFKIVHPSIIHGTTPESLSQHM
jgi:hypothetical protein